MTPEEFCELKPSELLRHAMRDLEKCEKDPRYTIDMGTWHQPYGLDEEDEVCAVCLAGSVMAKSLGCDPSFDLTPTTMARSEPVATRLEALDSFRAGYIQGGVLLCIPYASGEILDRISDFELYDRNVATYRMAPLRFKEDMEHIARFLDEECGL